MNLKFILDSVVILINDMQVIKLTKFGNVIRNIQNKLGKPGKL